MKKEERERIEKEIADINKSISEKETEIMNTPEYKKIQEVIDELDGGKREDSLKYNELRNNIYGKYGLHYSYYRRVRVNDIKSSVKQGIKVGLGMKNLKSIEDNIIEIVEKMISEDLKEPKIEALKQKNLKAEEKIRKLVGDKNKLVEDGIGTLIEKRNKSSKELYEKKPIENKKLQKQKEEANEKMKNLPQHFPKIIKEVNKRLILDGIEK